MPKDFKKGKYDVAIIGGGISGLYCAMKLIQHPLARDHERGIQDIVILEKSDRWGGRLETDIVAIPDHNKITIVKEEQGAMRFTYKDPDKKPECNMPKLSRLIKDLHMEDEVVPFYMRPQPPNQPDNNARYFRGRYFTEWYAKQNPTIWHDMFSLDNDEKFKSAGDIITDIYRKMLDHNMHKIQSRFPNEAAVIIAQKDKDKALLQEYENPEYWAFFRNKFTWHVGLQEIPLNNFSMHALLIQMGYSYACCMMMMQTQGFHCVSSTMGNVGSILQLLIQFTLFEPDHLYQFKGGWSSLVKNVKKAIEDNSSGIEVELQKKSKVEGISKAGDNFTLTIVSEDKQGNKKTDYVTADHVVMALPPNAVKVIFNSWTYSTNEELRDMTVFTKVIRLCDSVIGIHMTKINLFFEKAWWNKDENVQMFGPNVTSLPCGFVYPFYGNCKKTRNCKGCPDCSDDPCPAALTIYCDVNNAQFWSSLQRLGHKFQSPHQQGSKGDLAPASEAVVMEAIRQLKKIFNCTDIPDPIRTSYRSWDGGAEYGYAIHQWGIGVNDMEIEVAQPVKDWNLYFCNEAWSDYQGWVEGALLSTENVVDKILPVPKQLGRQ